MPKVKNQSREKKPAQGYDVQAILRKMWGITAKGGTIQKKSIRCGKSNCTKCPHNFYAYYVRYFMGKYEWEYLGKCDAMSRPVKSK